jgi:hypothetical protein
MLVCCVDGAAVEDRGCPVEAPVWTEEAGAGSDAFENGADDA